MCHRFRINVSVVVFALAAACAPSSEKGSANRLVQLKLGSDWRTRVAAEVSAIRSTTDESRLRKLALRATVSKVESQVREALEAAKAESLMDVIIGVEAPRPLPALPALDPREPRGSSKNQRLLAGRRALLLNERLERLATQTPYVQQIAAGGGMVFDQHTLCNCFAAKVPPALLARLVEDPSIRHIDPWFTGDPPPRNDSVADGRRIIGSDPYFDLIVSPQVFNNYIGLLDTGVRPSHVLYNSPDRISSLRDCGYGGGQCEDIGDPRFNPLDTYWNHGTSTGAIISGNENLGDPSRGITYLNIDSWNIYPGGGGLDINASIRAFNASVLVGDGVLVAEMQPLFSPASNLAVASNDAYDSGSAVIAANGNYGPGPRTVASPANAQKAIGVGAFDIDRLTQEGYQSRGPTVDNRIKPDLQMPTNSITASNVSDEALHSFGGTSGATPYASGAAASLRNWYLAQELCSSDDCPPGLIYAALLMFGSKFGPLEWDNTVGTGSTHLGVIDPKCSHWLVGSATLEGDGAMLDIPFDADSDRDADFRSAVWWPDSLDGSTLIHSEVDLFILDPLGVEIASSVSDNSVFENAMVEGAMASGKWTIRLVGAQIPQPQIAYYAAYAGGGQGCP